jgi:hypothetical protein
MVAVGGDDKVMANWFPMVLKPSVQLWLMNQLSRSIGSRVSYRERFVEAFQARYKRSGTMNGLRLVIQGPDGRLHSFMLHFSQVSHSIPNANDGMIINTFQRNVHGVRMLEKMGKKQSYLRTTHNLYSLANRCALMEEGCDDA